MAFIPLMSQAKGTKANLAIYGGIIGVALWLISCIPPIPIPFTSGEWYLLPPKITYILQYWTNIFWFVMVQVAFFMLYGVIFRFVKAKVIPRINTIEQLPERVQNFFYSKY
jgi:hypothetical protein